MCSSATSTTKAAPGANTVSLNQARANFRELGVSEPRFKAHVRLPLPEEHPWPSRRSAHVEAGRGSGRGLGPRFGGAVWGGG